MAVFLDPETLEIFFFFFKGTPYTNLSSCFPDEDDACTSDFYLLSFVPLYEDALA